MQTIGNQRAFRQRIIFLELGVKMTDIDGYYDVNGKGYIFVEVKACGAKVSPPQKKAFTNLTKSCGKDKPAMLVVAEHSTPWEDDVNLATCEVRSLSVVVPALGELEEWRADDFDLGSFNVNDAFAAFHFLVGQPYNAVLPTDTENLFNLNDSPFVALDSFQSLI